MSDLKEILEIGAVLAPDDPTAEDYQEFEASLKNATMSGHTEQQRRELYSFFRLNGEPLAKLSTPIGELKHAIRDLNRSQLKLLQDNLAGFFFDRPNFRRAYPDGYELVQAPDPCPPYGSRPGAFNFATVGPANIHHRLSRVARAASDRVGEITTPEGLLAFFAKTFSDYGIVFEGHVESGGIVETGVVTDHTFRFRNIEAPDEVVERFWRSYGADYFEATSAAVVQFLQVTFLFFLPQNPKGPNSSRKSGRKTKLADLLSLPLDTKGAVS